MVPTSYTVQEFVNYLRDEVLRDSAVPLGWDDFVSPSRPAPEVHTVSSNTTNVLTLSSGLIAAFPTDTFITVDNGDLLQTTSDKAIGATTLDIAPVTTTNHYQTHKIALFSPELARVQNPKYLYVVDEALRQMGLENIEQIDASNIRDFRLRGRLELLRRIAEGKTSNYDYTLNYDGAIQDPPIAPTEVARVRVVEHVSELYSRELNRITTEVVETVTPVINPSTPDESNSVSTQVAIRW